MTAPAAAFGPGQTLTLTLDEGQRQMLLMALAHLAVERPGWTWALEQIARPIDEPGTDEGPKLMREFARMHAEAPFDARVETEIERRRPQRDPGQEGIQAARGVQA